MSNCGRRGRSRDSMLVPNLRPKVVPHGPRLLPRLIVRIGGRLVAGCPWAGPAPPGSSGSAHGSGGHHLGDPGPVAALQKREGLLALRFFSPALLLPEALCSQGQLNRRVRALEPELRALQRSLAEELSHPSAVYRVMDTTLIPAIVRVRASRKGHFFCGQATFGRSASKTEWVYGFKVALVVDPGGVITAFFLAAASSDERPIGDALVASDRHEAYLWQTKGLRGCNHPNEESREDIHLRDGRTSSATAPLSRARTAPATVGCGTSATLQSAGGPKKCWRNRTSCSRLS